MQPPNTVSSPRRRGPIVRLYDCGRTDPRLRGDDKLLLMVMMALLCWVTPARAQPDGMFTAEPRCVTLINESGGDVLGHVETALYTDPKGKNHWFRKNFKLAENGREEACSTGPFFPGQKIRVVLKSLFPLYTCLIEVPRTITISRKKGDFFTTDLIMDCPQETAAATS